MDGRVKMRIIINRGLPGSGKSHWIDYVESVKTVVSFDKHRCWSGVYSFKLKDEAEVKKKAEIDFLLALERKDELIIIDNTNLQLKTFKKFIDEGVKNKYDVLIFSFKPFDVGDHYERQSHDIPYETLVEMAKKYDVKIDIPMTKNIVVETEKQIFKELEKRGIKHNYEMPDGRHSKIKADKTKTNDRVFIVAQLIISGASRFYIRSWIKQKSDWKIGARQANNYIKKADDLIKESQKADVSVLIAQQAERLDEIYLKSHKLQDYKTCLQILREKSVLLGLNKKPELDLTSGGEAFTGFKVVLVNDEDGSEKEI